MDKVRAIIVQCLVWWPIACVVWWPIVCVVWWPIACVVLWPIACSMVAYSLCSTVAYSLCSMVAYSLCSMVAYSLCSTVAYSLCSMVAYSLCSIVAYSRVYDIYPAVCTQMVEYLVGDGPNNRYALVCSDCKSHNGMALRDEFEYITFRCAYCYSLNPARKKRPSLQPAAPLPQRERTASEDNGAEVTILVLMCSIWEYTYSRSGRLTGVSSFQ